MKKQRSSALTPGSKLPHRSLQQPSSFYYFSSFSPFLSFHSASKNVPGRLEKESCVTVAMAGTFAMAAFRYSGPLLSALCL